MNTDYYSQDYELKFGLLDDLYTVIDVEGKLGGAIEENVGGYDLIYLMHNNNHTCNNAHYKGGRRVTASFI